MDRTQKYKKILIFAGAIVLFVIVIVFALKSCSREKSSENHDGDIGQEVIIEEQESEDGLDIEGAEDADASDSEDAVEFIGPDEAENNGQKPSKDNGTEDGQSANGNSGNEKEENENDENQNSGFDEEVTESNSGKYGTFF